MMNKNQKKQAIAVTLATSLLVGGTLAWQSFSQSALNESAGVNGDVGVRLHNDFNGSNADVYVENFATEEGSIAYTRVRIHEYMEYGEYAGVLEDDVSVEYPRDEDTITLVRGDKEIKEGTLVDPDFKPNINEKDTWDIYLYEEDANTVDDETIRDYITVNYGDIDDADYGSKVYMPTFMKDFDDKIADIKGAIDDGGNRYDGIDAYSAYIEYTVGEAVTTTATYNNMSEAATSAGTNLIEETHYAQDTNTAIVMSMDEWMNGSYYGPGDYWVYDTDGWAYWANGLAPQSATGLLVNSITNTRIPDEDWYYGLHVVCESATAGDWGDKDSTDTTEQGMYAEGMTQNAEDLLDGLAAMENISSISLMSNSMDMSLGGHETVTIGGITYYILDTRTITGVDENGYSTGKQNAALLWAMDSVMDVSFNSTEEISWSTSDMRNVVLADWLVSQPALEMVAIRVPVVTDGYYGDAISYTSTEEIDEVTYDKVFLLSQMEYLVTYAVGGTASAYSSEDVSSWLRSAGSEVAMRMANHIAGSIYDAPVAATEIAGVRPALWVTY